jgi:hypothetical protein
VVDATKKAVVDTVDSIETSIENTVNQTKRSLEQTAKDVASLPSKKVKEVRPSPSVPKSVCQQQIKSNQHNKPNQTKPLSKRESLE